MQDAYGYRDQLQDVLPLILLAPELARQQILMHGRQQFVQGDVLKWWHESPQAASASASAPTPPIRISGCPTSPRAMSRRRATTPFSTNPALHRRRARAAGRRGPCDFPLPSREKASLFEHCRRAIEHTLGRFGANGLPLMGAGDWDDGMNLSASAGAARACGWAFSSTTFSPVLSRSARRAANTKLTHKLRSRAENLQAALDSCWRGDRFVRAFAAMAKRSCPWARCPPRGRSLSQARCRTSAERKALENGLAALDKGERVLLVTPPYDENSKPFPAAAPITRPACARMAANIHTAHRGSWTRW